MLWAIRLVTGWGVSAKLAKPILIGTGALLLCLMLWGAKGLYDHRLIREHDKDQTIKVLKQVAPANDKAANDRVIDTVKITNEERTTHEAIKVTPDQKAAPSTVALGCRRLRAQGTDISRIPACRGY